MMVQAPPTGRYVASVTVTSTGEHYSNGTSVGHVAPPLGTQWFTYGRFTVAISYSDGQFIAEDTDGHSYGVASSMNDALQDWWNGLNGRYQVLLEDEQDLAPYLADDLRV